MRIVNILKINLFLIALTGCSSKLGTVNMHYKQEQPVNMYNMKMERCIQTGELQLYKETPASVRYYYKNCDLIIIRELQEYELKHWGLERKK